MTNYPGRGRCLPVPVRFPLVQSVWRTPTGRLGRPNPGRALAPGSSPRLWVPPIRTAQGVGTGVEDETEPPSQDPDSFRHGDSPCQPDDALCAADGSRLTEADDQILEALALVVQASGPFSFGLLTNTLSVTEQLGFGYKLISAAGRIRTRVEKTSGDHRLRTADGNAS